MSESVASQSTDQFPESGRRVTRTDGRTDGDELVTERDRVRVSNARACWEWTGYRDPLGYGMTALIVDGTRKTMKAHRAVYLTCVGDVPAGLFLLHSCDNPPCCNPAHLRPGTQIENMHRPAALATPRARRSTTRCNSMTVWSPPSGRSTARATGSSARQGSLGSTG
jgi:hypothetical protein